jgi:hypothetical protein
VTPLTGAVPERSAAAAGPVYLQKVSPAVGWVTPNFTHHYGRIGENFASPAVADADGDGRPEIVAGFPDGNVYAWHASAAQPFLTFFTGAGAVQASPSLVDLTATGA